MKTKTLLQIRSTNSEYRILRIPNKQIKKFLLLNSSILLFFCSFVLLSLSAVAQAPESIKYQAVLRDNGGTIIANQAVGLRISIWNSTVVEYQETHAVTTNTYGLTTINIGDGSVVSGIFSSIAWESDEYFVQIEVDAGTGYVDMGTTQLLSVPYALHAKTADNFTGTITETDPEVGSNTLGYSPKWDGSALVTGAIFQDGSDNIGIGTETPAYKVDVSSDMRIFNSNDFPGLYFSQAVSNVPGVSGYSTAIRNPVESTARGMAFYTQYQGTFSEKMRITGTGNVGIGTSTPQYRTHLRATGSTPTTLLNIHLSGTTTNQAAMIRFTNTSILDATGQGSSYIAGIRTSSSTGTQALAFGTSPNLDPPVERLRIDGSGNVGINITTPTALLHTYGTNTGEGNVLFEGEFKNSNPGNPPATGAGTRMMWYPDKAAFRAGNISGTEWDISNIGNYSVAMGYGTIASGGASVAMGDGSNASGYSSFATGGYCVASGYSSRAMGSMSTASGLHSTALGRLANAFGNYSFAINLSEVAGPNVGANTFRISGAAEIGGNVAWTNHSDKRLKKNIELLSAENNLSKILQLHGVRYEWKEYNNNLNLGFIAQDVIDILPEAVRYDADNDIYSMEYTAIIPVLVEGIKEQQNIIELQQKDFEALKLITEQQNQRIQNLEFLIEQQQVQISVLLKMDSEITVKE